jgi:hypothetical protein
MQTEQAKTLYGRRKELVEPVFGIIKEQQGLRRFLLRSRTNVTSEWKLLATAFNLRTLARLWQRYPALLTRQSAARLPADPRLHHHPLDTEP